jgi:hypothetical protein
MDQTQIKEFIASKIPEGYSLSRIQDFLKEQGVQITFMELRLLASEIEESIFKQEEEKAAAAEQAKHPAAEPPREESVSPQEEDTLPPYARRAPLPEEEQFAQEEAVKDASPADGTDAASPVRGKTVVELSKLARPGAIASGTVKFGSGVTAEWIFDQMQRLSLTNASGQPDQRDIQEFQIELQKLFS